MKKILVLGASGMLGSMVFDYCNQVDRYELRGTLPKQDTYLDAKYGSDRWHIFDAEQDNANDLTKILLTYRPDHIINCIGIIKPYCKDDNPAGVARAILVNAHFPQLLATAAKEVGARVIQIATDCVYSGNIGDYTEHSLHDALDVYGKTKSLAELRRRLPGDNRRAVVLTAEYDAAALRAGRNVPQTQVREAREVSVVDLLRFQYVIATEAAIKVLAERLTR